MRKPQKRDPVYYAKQIVQILEPLDWATAHAAFNIARDLRTHAERSQPIPSFHSALDTVTGKAK